MLRPRVLIARQDNAGDVLLSGPAVRAVAAATGPVAYLCSPRGEAAARLLPGVGDVLVHAAPWIDADPGPVEQAAVGALVEEIERGCFEEAVVLTSFHQSPLPLALLLRLAGVPTVAAISVDYPGSLLDVRHLVDDDVHEVSRYLSLVGRLGYRLPAGDDGRLQVALPRGTTAPAETPAPPYVVVHPGASVTARAWEPDACAAAVAALAGAGYRVAVTGSEAERSLTSYVAAGGGVDLGGRTGLAGLAAVLAGANAVVVGNTGPAHLAAAVGTPVVSLYAPTVPPSRWRPWKVPHVLLGDQDIACAGCRARDCPVPGHPCLAEVDPGDVVGAVRVVGDDRDRQLVGGL